MGVVFRTKLELKIAKKLEKTFSGKFQDYLEINE